MSYELSFFFRMDNLFRDLLADFLLDLTDQSWVYTNMYSSIKHRQRRAGLSWPAETRPSMLPIMVWEACKNLGPIFRDSYLFGQSRVQISGFLNISTTLICSRSGSKSLCQLWFFTFVWPVPLCKKQSSVSRRSRQTPQLTVSTRGADSRSGKRPP